MGGVARKRYPIRMGWTGLWRGVLVGTTLVIIPFAVRTALRFTEPPPWEGGYLLVAATLIFGTVFLLIGVPVIGGLIALLLDLWLRRVTDWRWHLTVFAVTGFVIGAAPTVLTLASKRPDGLVPAYDQQLLEVGITNALILAAASSAGWLVAWLLYRRDLPWNLRPRD